MLRKTLKLLPILIVLLLGGCSRDDSGEKSNTIETTSSLTIENYYDEEQKKLVDLIYGEWICETEGARIEVYDRGESYYHYYVNISSDKNVHINGEQLYYAPIFNIDDEIPHWYTLSEEEYPSDTETAIWISSRDGEFDYEMLFIVDKEGKYIKHKFISGDSKWYYFYPSENE